MNKDHLSDKTKDWPPSHFPVMSYWWTQLSLAWNKYFNLLNNSQFDVRWVI